jgi:hypothetical protein
LASSSKSGWISWRLLNNFLFYRVGLLARRSTPLPEDQASVLISTRGRVATHFSRLLWHAWVTVRLFLFPGHHTEKLNMTAQKNYTWISGILHIGVCTSNTRCRSLEYVGPIFIMILQNDDILPHHFTMSQLKITATSYNAGSFTPTSPIHHNGVCLGTGTTLLFIKGKLYFCQPHLHLCFKASRRDEDPPPSPH